MRLMEANINFMKFYKIIPNCFRSLKELVFLFWGFQERGQGPLCSKVPETISTPQRLQQWPTYFGTNFCKDMKLTKILAFSLKTLESSWNGFGSPFPPICTSRNPCSHTSIPQPLPCKVMGPVLQILEFLELS